MTSEEFKTPTANKLPLGCVFAGVIVVLIRPPRTEIFLLHETKESVRKKGKLHKRLVCVFAPNVRDFGEMELPYWCREAFPPLRYIHAYESESGAAWPPLPH